MHESWRNTVPLQQNEGGKENSRGITSFAENLQANCIVGMVVANKLHFSHGREE
jgi:hypothetical protein